MFEKLQEFFLHKKWLAAIGTVIGLIASAMTGSQEWDLVIKEIVAVVITVISAQAVIDTATVVKNGGASK